MELQNIKDSESNLGVGQSCETYHYTWFQAGSYRNKNSMILAKGNTSQ